MSVGIASSAPQGIWQAFFFFLMWTYQRRLHVLLSVARAKRPGVIARLRESGPGRARLYLFSSSSPSLAHVCQLPMSTYDELISQTSLSSMLTRPRRRTGKQQTYSQAIVAAMLSVSKFRPARQPHVPKPSPHCSSQTAAFRSYSPVSQAYRVNQTWANIIDLTMANLGLTAQEESQERRTLSPSSRSSLTSRGTRAPDF